MDKMGIGRCYPQSYPQMERKRGEKAAKSCAVLGEERKAVEKERAKSSGKGKADQKREGILLKILRKRFVILRGEWYNKNKKITAAGKVRRKGEIGYGKNYG